MSTRVPNTPPEGEPLPDPSPEEPDTTVSHAVVHSTEPRRAATFGPAVTTNPGPHERTDATVKLEPTAPMIPPPTAGRRSWTTRSALAIGALLLLALLVAYASCR